MTRNKLVNPNILADTITKDKKNSYFIKLASYIGTNSDYYTWCKADFLRGTGSNNDMTSDKLVQSKTSIRKLLHMVTQSVISSQLVP